MAADPLDALAAALAQVRAAVWRIVEQREAAERRYGAVVVEHARLTEMVRDQRSSLERSRAEIDRARALAGRAAEAARGEGADPTPYEQTAAALAREADVLAAAGRQLSVADAAGTDNLARARELLADNRGRLDASLREQLRLLATLERLAREARPATREE